MTETYVVHARTPVSSMGFSTKDPHDALKRAREMEGSRLDVTVTDESGNTYTLAELEAALSVQSGA